MVQKRNYNGEEIWFITKTSSNQTEEIPSETLLSMIHYGLRTKEVMRSRAATPPQ